MQIVNWNDIATRVIGAAVLASIVGVYHLWDRIKDLESEYKRNKLARDLETKHEAEGRDARNQDARDMGKTIESFTALMVKVETLLDVGLKRLDIVEKIVFKLP